MPYVYSGVQWAGIHFSHHPQANTLENDFIFPLQLTCPSPHSICCYPRLVPWAVHHHSQEKWAKADCYGQGKRFLEFHSPSWYHWLFSTFIIPPAIYQSKVKYKLHLYREVGGISFIYTNSHSISFNVTRLIWLYTFSAKNISSNSDCND